MIISRTVFNFQLTEQTGVHKRNGYVQCTPKVSKPDLQLMSSERCHIVLNIFVKFRENILDGFRVMERTQMMEVLTNRRTDIWTDRRTHKISDGIT